MPLILIYTLAILLLSACAEPFVSPIMIGNETGMDCPTLYGELQLAEKYLQDAYDENRFRMSDALIVPGMMSRANITEARQAAEHRYDYIEYLMQMKGCPPPAVMRNMPKAVKRVE